MPLQNLKINKIKNHQNQNLKIEIMFQKYQIQICKSRTNNEKQMTSCHIARG